jgi:hypothetical protein
MKQAARAVLLARAARRVGPARLALTVLGVAAMGYACYGAAGSPDIRPTRHVAFLVAVLVVHDGLLLPAFLGVGALVGRYVPGRVRAPVQAALIITASVTFVGLPLALGFGRRPDNPSVLPLNYPRGLLIATAISWLVPVGLLALPRIRAAAGRIAQGRSPRDHGKSPVP